MHIVPTAPQTAPEPNAPSTRDVAEDTLDRIEDGGPTRIELTECLVTLCGCIAEWDLRFQDHSLNSRGMPPSVSITLRGLSVEDFAHIYDVALRANVRHPEWSRGFKLNPHAGPRYSPTEKGA